MFYCAVASGAAQSWGRVGEKGGEEKGYACCGIFPRIFSLSVVVQTLCKSCSP